MTVEQLKGLLVEYGIDEADIPSSGASGKVVKSDIVAAIKEYEQNNGISQPKGKKTDGTTKPKPKSTTAGLKAGDKIMFDNGEVRFEAVTINVLATTKAQIKALTYINEQFNPNVVSDVNRKFMTIVGVETLPVRVVDPNITVISITKGNNIKTLNIENLDLDMITTTLSNMMLQNGYKFEAS